MTKRFLLIMLLTTPIVLSAQNTQNHTKKENNHSSSIILGGAMNYWYDSNNKSHSFHLHPEVAFFVSDRCAIGSGLGFGMFKSQSNDELVNSYLDHIVFSVSPFVRYFYFYKLPFKLYLDGGFGYSIYKFYDSNNSATHGFEIGIRPGASLDLAEGLCLCLHFGFVGYRKDYIEPGLGSSGFGFSFTPHTLSIGLDFEF
ncbi:MAG: hypothetical protein ACOX4D_07280 [Bacteroidales bacterium]|jgi:hypothetical protein